MVAGLSKDELLTRIERRAPRTPIAGPLPADLSCLVRQREISDEALTLDPDRRLTLMADPDSRKEINMLRQLRLVLPLALVALALAAPARGVIAIIVDWRPLTGDIVTLVPPVLQTSLFAKVDAAAMAAERGQLCTTVRILGALEHELRANANARIGDPNVIGDGSVRVLEADIAVVLASLPPDPCVGDPQIQTDSPVDAEVARPLGDAGLYS